MSLFTQVDPATFDPPNGRGAWVRSGIEFDYRYRTGTDASKRIGTRAEVSLAHWAVAAGSYAIQVRLMQLGVLAKIGENEKGIFGPKTEQAVKLFQGRNSDPENGRPLTVDGIVGKSDARALFTPMIHAAEAKYDIPGGALLGQTNHESVLDPGAVGYFIYYPDFRGADRGMSQINAKANPQVTWEQAFDPTFSFDWSAARLRAYYDKFKKAYPKAPDSVLWDAAVCAHNNPSAAAKWAANGLAPTEAAAKYVAAVRAATY